MTEITITANGKPYYHSRINRTLTEVEIAREIEEATCPKPDVEFQVIVKTDQP